MSDTPWRWRSPPSTRRWCCWRKWSSSVGSSDMVNGQREVARGPSRSFLLSTDATDFRAMLVVGVAPARRRTTFFAATGHSLRETRPRREWASNRSHLWMARTKWWSSPSPPRRRHRAEVDHPALLSRPEGGRERPVEPVSAVHRCHRFPGHACCGRRPGPSPHDVLRSDGRQSARNQAATGMGRQSVSSVDGQDKVDHPARLSRPEGGERWPMLSAGARRSA
jgi:hypothetical protein